MTASRASVGAALTAAFDGFLEHYGHLRFTGGPVTAARQRVSVHPSLRFCFLAGLRACLELLELAPTGMPLREYLALSLEQLPAGVFNKPALAEMAKAVRSGKRGSFLDQACPWIIGVLSHAIQNVRAPDEAADALERRGSARIAPKQRRLLEVVQGSEGQQERIVLRLLYGVEAARAPERKRAKARLRKLVRDANGALEALGLPRVQRRISRRPGIDSQLWWPYHGTLP